MGASIKQQVAAMPGHTVGDRAMRSLLTAVLSDLEELHTQVAALQADNAALAAKLDADAGVSDTDYEAGLTAEAPAALNLTE